MRRYLYSNLIRILVDIFLGIVFLPTLVFMIWEILTDGVIDKMYYAICFRCIIYIPASRITKLTAVAMLKCASEKYAAR